MLGRPRGSMFRAAGIRRSGGRYQSFGRPVSVVRRPVCDTSYRDHGAESRVALGRDRRHPSLDKRLQGGAGRRLQPERNPRLAVLHRVHDEGKPLREPIEHERPSGIDRQRRCTADPRAALGYIGHAHCLSGTTRRFDPRRQIERRTAVSCVG